MSANKPQLGGNDLWLLVDMARASSGTQATYSLTPDDVPAAQRLEQAGLVQRDPARLHTAQLTAHGLETVEHLVLSLRFSLNP